MHKRIRQLAKGQFDFEKPELVLPQAPIQFTIMGNQDFEGSFSVKSANGTAIRGMVYSTVSRMEVLTPSIEGSDCLVRFVCHGSGLSEGNMVRGDFYLICGGSSVKIPYQGVAAAHTFESSVGSIRNLADFTELARENWQEAYRLFYHPCFSAMLADSSRQQQLIYRGMTGIGATDQNLEEFLVGCGLKKKILFTLEDREVMLGTLQEDTDGHLDLLKDGWGYLHITADCRESFLTLEKTEFTTADFLGNGCRVNFHIDAAKLHFGINRARITFTSCYQTEDLVLTVKSGKSKQPSEASIIRRQTSRLLELYRSWRVRKITTAEWAKKSLDLLEKLEILSPSETIYSLIRIYIQIQNRQRKTAENLLTVYGDSREPAGDTEVLILQAYLHYLLQKDSAEREKYAEAIETLYLRDSDRDLVFYVWYLLQKVNCNEEELYRNLRVRMTEKKNASVFVYAEYYSLLTQKPELIASLNPTDLRVLAWAMRRSTITDNVAQRIMALADQSREAKMNIFAIMKTIYAQHPDKVYLGIICRYLIRARKFSPEYLEWYEKGIEQEVRITGLYEAYLQSLDEEQEHKLPKILQMYFQYDSQLPYQKMAVLYRNIIAGKKKESAIYQKYLKNMSHFALEQAQAKHMNSNLAVIYKEMLPPDVINQHTAEAFAHILFTYKITVPDTEKDIASVVVCQWQRRKPQEVMLVGNTAYVQIESADYCILLEDARGNRFASSRQVSCEPLMDQALYLDTCLPMAPEELPYILAALETRPVSQAMEILNEQCFDRFLLQEEVSDVYRAEIEPEILLQLQKQGISERMKRYLAVADFGMLKEEARKTFTGLMSSAGMYDYVWEKMQEFGAEVLDAENRLPVFSYMTEKLDGEEDERLMVMMLETLLEGKYNQETIGYLCHLYVGPTKAMTAIWNAAGRYGLKSSALEERILITALYTGDDLQKIVPVFLHYYKTGGRELILQAYLSACSHAYFVRKQPMNEVLFEVLQKRLTGGREVNEICRLALLYYLSGVSRPEEDQLAVCDRLMEEFTGRNMYFAFYKKLDDRFQKKYHLTDKVFLEYRAKPDTRVVLHVSRDEDGQEFHAEDMQEMYSGIYVKSFIIFFGEQIRYYITEENGHEVELQESSRLTQEQGSKKEEGRFAMINQILMSQLLRDDAQMEEDLCDFRAHMDAQKTLFGLL